MKNTLKRILETQELTYVNKNNTFTYEFCKESEYVKHVNISRLTNCEFFSNVNSLMDVDAWYYSPRQSENGNFIYYSLRIEGIPYYVSVTKEEDLYFQNLLQNAYKKYQLKMFECINSEIDKSIEQKTNNASERFEKEQQNVVNNDKE